MSVASIVRLRPAAGAHLPFARPFGRRLADLAAGLIRPARARQELRRLTDRQLRDIGLERADVADPLAASPRARGSGW
jgi:uncharacterized protein YjiS (DUF1127 family)